MNNNTRGALQSKLVTSTQECSSHCAVHEMDLNSSKSLVIVSFNNKPISDDLADVATSPVAAF